ncbi:MAG: hypothetical protein ABI977_20045 [Acidobacteriota bacterium]
MIWQPARGREDRNRRLQSILHQNAESLAANPDRQADRIGFRIEPNISTAHGKPGSVDNSKQQQRGQRLAVKNKKPVSGARVWMRLDTIRQPHKAGKTIH